jgi:predicted flavoprotein YhiN
VATGGRGYPALGGTGSGYVLARQAGHTVIEPTPALVPLVVPVVLNLFFGLFVGLIQAFVFSMLAVIYINTAVSE